MTVEETLRAYDLYDAEIVTHGFLPTMRDYRLGVQRLDYEPLGTFDYVFRGCMEARYEVTLRPEAVSLDDRLLDQQSSQELDVPLGFQWWVATACSSEEGVHHSRVSERARFWEERLALPMHELVISTNVYRLALVFHDLVVTPVADLSPTIQHLNGQGHR